MSSLTPRQIVQELDKHIVGQDAAKRAVAIALRNRWRRMQVSEPLRQEITPKNILMIGPTGVGKTEIARRLAKLANAPFVKVEATKFTEVGYVGRDVDSIVKDLADVAVKITREQEMAKVRERALDAAEERVLDTLLPKPRMMGFSTDEPAPARDGETRQKFRKMLREHELDEREIEIELRILPMGVEIMAPPGMEEMQQQLQSMFQNLGGNRTRTRKLKVREALKLLTDEEAGKLINEDELKIQAVANAEQNGIVFIDEIDKVTRRQETLGADVSRDLDEVDIHLNPKIGPDWTKRGRQKEVLTPGCNEKRYLGGAWNPKTRRLTYVEGERKNSLLFLELLYKLVTKTYSNAKRIHIILDNYGIHDSLQVRLALKSEAAQKLKLHFLPPYCPDHNRIERIWKDLHDNVTRNHRCATMDELMAEVRCYLASRNRCGRHKYPRTKAA